MTNVQDFAHNMGRPPELIFECDHNMDLDYNMLTINYLEKKLPWIMKDPRRREVKIITLLRLANEVQTCYRNLDILGIKPNLIEFPWVSKEPQVVTQKQEKFKGLDLMILMVIYRPVKENWKEYTTTKFGHIEMIRRTIHVLSSENATFDRGKETRKKFIGLVIM